MRAISASVGIILGFLLGVLIVLYSGVSPDIYFNLLGLVLVFGGTISAILLSFSPREILRVFKVVLRIFFRSQISTRKIAFEVLRIARDLESSSFDKLKPSREHPFIDDCCTLIRDAYSDEDIGRILGQRIQSIYNQESQDTSLIRSMAKYPPAFGMIGTVVGLIALMASIGGNIDMSSIGTYMAVALTTTLYGLALSNFIFKPIADNMEMGSSRSLRARQMILESMILVKHRASLLVIQDTLNSFLPITENIDIMSTHAKEANDAA